MSAARHPQGYAFADFRLDLQSYQLRRSGRLVSLTPKVFDTLVALVQRRDQTVSKDELMNAVWPDAFVSEDNLTQAISVLRRALGDDPSQPTFIATSARHGYRFVAPVRELPAASVEERASGPSAIWSGLESRRVRLARRWIVAAIVAGALAAGALVIRSMSARAVGTRATLRFSQEAPDGTVLASGGVISPDGQSLAFVAEDEQTGHTRLWVRPLDAAQPRAIADTDNAARPFWSPDSQSLAFFENGKLKRIGLREARARIVASVGPNAEGGSWGTHGLILFAGGRSGLYSVPASGGPSTPVTALDPSTRDVRHSWPQFLPDGETFLFYVDSPTPGRTGTFMGRIGSPAIQRLVDVPAIYASGSLLYIRDRVLSAVRFDVSSHRLGTTSSPLAVNVVAPSVANQAVVSASRDGLLAFTASKDGEHLEWFSRAGERLGLIDAPVALRNPVFLPGQRRLLAASNGDADHKGLWMIDADRGALTRVASDGMRPVASPDGADIVFTSDRAAGVADIYTRKLAARDGDEQSLVRTPENKFVCDWSPDGEYIVFGSTNPRTKTDLWAVSRRDRRTIPLLRSPANETCGEISPDGRRIAYASDESGTWQVYVDTFPITGHRQAVSSRGGVEPHWKRDGTELFFLGLDRTLAVVDVAPTGAWNVSAPTPLFRLAVAAVNPYINQYAVSADAERFVVHVTLSAEHGQGQVTVLVNWPALLKP